MTLRGLGFEHGFHGIHGWTGALWERWNHEFYELNE